MDAIRIHFDRARLLLQQRRYADAERELRQALTSDPNFPEAHALLAEALLDQQRLDEATAEASLAIQQDPELELGHFVMARVLIARNRHAEAEQATLRAIQLYPHPRSFGLLAAIRLEVRDWRGALQAADEGLTLDPENSVCLNFRAMALRQLGRHDEADFVLRGALENDPDDSYAHANRGWSELQRRRPREALVHFKEALRLDPSNDHARAGLVEAMKARYFLYRIILGYFLWMNRLQRSAQMVIVIGGWMGYQALRAFSSTHPQYKWLTWPIMGAYIVFAWMTWLAAPLMNLALRLHPIGRYALSDNQRRTANVVGGLLLGVALTVTLAFTSGPPELLILAIALGFATLPGSLIFIADSGWPRLVLAAMTLSVIVLGVLLVLADLGHLGEAAPNALGSLILPVMLACVLGGQIIAAQRVRR